MIPNKPLTPMMAQYYALKQQNPESILFYRLGDFYEMFDDDARIVSSELDLLLTTRDRNLPPEQQTMMCGVPYHSAEAYLVRLVERGYTVSVCEQVGDPALSKGLMERKVVRHVTPGTITDGLGLDEGRNNFLCAVNFSGDMAGLCFADVSTGLILACHVTRGDGINAVKDEIARFKPREILVNSDAVAWFDIVAEFPVALTKTAADNWNTSTARHQTESTFGTVNAVDATVTAVGAILAYLIKTQETTSGLFDCLQLYRPALYMSLDMSSRRNLELTESMSGHRKGTLLSVLDKTMTPMGKRLLVDRLERPLRNVSAINDRLDAVTVLYKDMMVRGELIDALKPIGDLERMTNRACLGTTGPRELANLGEACGYISELKKHADCLHGALLIDIAQRIENLSDIALKVGECLCDEPSAKISDGEFIKPGYNAEVDELRKVRDSAAGIMAQMERNERDRTGIKTLKVGYNRVFGYYIEIGKANAANAPEDYERKQTLTNAERFVTPQLKEMEEKILTAKDKLQTLEESLFHKLRQDVAAQAARIRAVATAVAELDVIVSAAVIASKQRYCRPYVVENAEIEISEGRHPVVEHMQKDNLFVPNDAKLDCSNNTVVILTGPNMAGKSTYMRQNALIVLMAQAGFFVPAKDAVIGVVDAIFTRIGASDDLAGGRSTFMVEMTEVSEILRRATNKSLLILDEIGRGTSTFDGMAVAQSVLEYVAQKIGARSLFATHYHELTILDASLQNVVNYHITAKKRGDEIVFLRKVVRGGADDSFGVEVAQLAGLPKSVITRAKSLLAELERGSYNNDTKIIEQKDAPQISLAQITAMELVEELSKLSPETLSPIEAMNTLYQLTQRAKNI